MRSHSNPMNSWIPLWLQAQSRVLRRWLPSFAWHDVEAPPVAPGSFGFNGFYPLGIVVAWVKNHVGWTAFFLEGDGSKRPTRGHRFLGLMFYLIIGGPNFDLHRSLHHIWQFHIGHNQSQSTIIHFESFIGHSHISTCFFGQPWLVIVISFHISPLLGKLRLISHTHIRTHTHIYI